MDLISFAQHDFEHFPGWELKPGMVQKVLQNYMYILFKVCYPLVSGSKFKL
jgi:hypothetical protein